MWFCNKKFKNDINEASSLLINKLVACFFINNLFKKHKKIQIIEISSFISLIDNYPHNVNPPHNTICSNLHRPNKQLHINRLRIQTAPYSFIKITQLHRLKQSQF